MNTEKTRAMPDAVNKSDLDDIFTEIDDFGPYQIVTVILLTLLYTLTGATFMVYIISANALDYRCKVPECEFDADNRDLSYNRPWLRNAIPHGNEKFDNCHRYAPKNRTSDESLGQCAANMFDSSKTIQCTEYVYTTDEKNLQTEFNIHCTDTYKLAFVGSVDSFARFVALPICGLFCDKFGRLSGIVFGTELGFILATIKAFSFNYPMFIVLEFLENLATTFAFTGLFVYSIELMNAKYHVLISTLSNVCGSLGGIILGYVGYHVHDFRKMMLIFYIPSLFLFLYYWILPESIRWLLSTGRIDQAIDSLKKIAKFNGRELSENTIDAIKLKYTRKKQRSIALAENDEEHPSVFQSLWMVLKSEILCLRFVLCCWQWISCCFIYYGLSQSSMQIPNTNHYVNFIISMAIEIPCAILSQPLLSKMKRRTLLGGAFSLTAISIIATSFIHETYSTMMLLCSMVGKASITIAFIVIYLYTCEQWPTNVRTSIVNSCSMVGRIGSMTAPFAVLMESQYGSVSAILFGVTATIAAITVLFSPETFKKPLPNTIDEAKYL